MLLLSMVFIFTTGSNSYAADTAGDWLIQASKTTSNVDKVWTVTFSSDINEVSVGPKSVYVQDAAGQNVKVETNVNGKVMKVIPTSSYSVGNTYTLYLGADLKSVSDKAIKNKVKFQFTIKSSMTNKSIVIDGINANGVVADDVTYTVDESLKGLFSTSNEAALLGAKATLVVENNKIKQITSLELMNNGTERNPLTLDGKGTVIVGNLMVNGDYYTLKNMMINGDLLTGRLLKSNLVVEAVTIKGTAKVVDIATVATSMVASTNNLYAVNPVTRIKIIFKDSTVAVIEIGKDDTYLQASGSTKIEYVSLFANTNISADPDVILPRVDIHQGVTKIELNATIQNVSIESNDEIEVSGSGKFDNVTVNTDKKVTLSTTGMIGNLDVKNESSILNLGLESKIENIKLPAGKQAVDIVENLEDVKEHIKNINGEANSDYIPPTPGQETGDYFAAGLNSVENRFGYVTLNVKNPGNNKVKYVQETYNNIYRYNNLPKGSPVPNEAVDYVPNKEFILHADQRVIVYLVDGDNNIMDLKYIDDFHFYPYEHTLNKENNTITITTTNRYSEKTNSYVDYLYLYTLTGKYSVKDFSTLSWEKVDGLPTITLKPTLNLSNDEQIMIYLFSENGSAQSSFNYSVDNNAKLELHVLKEMLLDDFLKNNYYYERTLNQLSVERISKFDENGNYTHSEEKIIFEYETNSVSMKGYQTAIATSKLSTIDDLKTLIQAVDDSIKDKVLPYKQANALVEALFKEDRYDYEWQNQLAENITEQQINAAIDAVNKMSDEFTEKSRLLYETENAQNLLDSKNQNN